MYFLTIELFDDLGIVQVDKNGICKANVVGWFRKGMRHCVLRTRPFIAVAIKPLHEAIIQPVQLEMANEGGGPSINLIALFSMRVSGNRACVSRHVLPLGA